MTGGRVLMWGEYLPNLPPPYGVHHPMVRTLPCDGRDTGSIPLVSTNFPAVIGHMLAACHTTVKKVPTFRGVREFN